MPESLRRFAQNKPAATLWSALLAVFLFASAALGAIIFPPLTGRVVDQAHILSPATIGDITAKSAELEQKSGIQLVVATIPSLQDGDIETFGNQLFRAWKLGGAQKNNGLLLLVAPNERKVRIEVGYGLEGVMTDALSSVIIRTVIAPKFKAGDYSGGVAAGVDAITAALATDQAEWQAKAKAGQRASQPDMIDQLMPLLLLGLFLFIVFAMMRNARGSSGRWSRRGGNSIFIPMNSLPMNRSDWGGGSSWGSGSDSGFSGGGGSSGGGGASGDW